VGRGTSGQAYETPRRPGEAPGTSGRPREAREGPWDVGFLGCPKGFPGPPWAVRTSQELPGVSLGFFVGFRTSQRLLPASPGRPDIRGASPGSLGRPDEPGGFPGPFWSLLRLPRSLTDRHDRPYPSGQRSSGRASTPKVCFGICSLVRNFCSCAPLGGP
jgi:hypothetical protein